MPAPTSDHLAAVEPFEHLLRERRCGGGHRGGALADRGLDPGAPAGVERFAEGPVEQRAGDAGLERVADLAEDLTLAGNERVEPGGDTEEVERGRLVGQAVGDRRQRGGVVAGEGEQRLVGAVAEVRGSSAARYSSVRLHVDRTTASQDVPRAPRARACAAVEVDRDALAQLDRGAVVRDAGERELHDAKWVSGRTTATSTKPARSDHASRGRAGRASRRSSRQPRRAPRSDA